MCVCCLVAEYMAWSFSPVTSMSQELPTPIFIDQIEHILLFSCCKNENIFLFCKQKSTIPRFLSIKSGINQKIELKKSCPQIFTPTMTSV